MKCVLVLSQSLRATQKPYCCSRHQDTGGLSHCGCSLPLLSGGWCHDDKAAEGPFSSGAGGVVEEVGHTGVSAGHGGEADKVGGGLAELESCHGGHLTHSPVHLEYGRGR